MIAARLAADYLISLSDPDVGELMSHLKLQKLLYYSQGTHLAVFDEPLFSEAIYHWEHGPVVKDLYHELKHFGSDPLPAPINADFSQLSVEQKAILNEVYDVYGQFSAWKLRNMTHEESPWVDTAPGEEISWEKLKAFFKTQLAS